ncbi:SapC family protein [Limnohabitans sp. Rim8]|uniref:SapC family protein n=1 Tax=Limnohabitans sp. Rim8 TaxID=1100718 RepID=UPI002638744C|nr:SapC family protein [Limnohabitans sp. Rim8]
MKLMNVKLITAVLALFATIGVAHAQKPAVSAKDEAQMTAFFYKQPVVLNKDAHKGLHIKSGDARFASKVSSVPILMAEFPEACLEYPIVFTKSSEGQWMALAITGLTKDSNSFVDASGRWNARYVPASVRRYPFILAEGIDGKLSLAADLSAPHLGKEGAPLFDEKGQPTELVTGVMKSLAEFQDQANLTASVAQKLDDAKLLTQQNMQVKLSDGRNAVVEGVWIVDEAKLRDLSNDNILSLFKGGALAAVHAHMMSLRNLVVLLELTEAVKTASAKTQ